ncbi:MAG: hypothetical protein U1E22_09015, partial [Coriobacteriia bacterium]|nr:hypothetical protein [Coriobacteriia bacterium]
MNPMTCNRAWPPFQGARLIEVLGRRASGFWLVPVLAVILMVSGCSLSTHDVRDRERKAPATAPETWYELVEPLDPAQRLTAVEAAAPPPPEVMPTAALELPRMIGTLPRQQLDALPPEFSDNGIEGARIAEIVTLHVTGSSSRESVFESLEPVGWYLAVARLQGSFVGEMYVRRDEYGTYFA